MGGGQSRVEEHDATSVESEQNGRVDVKPSNTLLGRLEERSQASWNAVGETNTETSTSENVLLDGAKRQEVEDARAARRQQVQPLLIHERIRTLDALEYLNYE